MPNSVSQYHNHSLSVFSLARCLSPCTLSSRGLSLPLVIHPQNSPICHVIGLHPSLLTILTWLLWFGAQQHLEVYKFLIFLRWKDESFLWHKQCSVPIRLGNIKWIDGLSLYGTVSCLCCSFSITIIFSVSSHIQLLLIKCTAINCWKTKWYYLEHRKKVYFL